jgi:hypothetical protein
MIPYEVDPSLHNNRPPEPVLDDGFSPPEPPQPPATESATSVPPGQAGDPLGDKSGF